MAADEESEARVSSWRAEIDRVTDEALSLSRADATEKVSMRSRLVELWVAVVSKTNDAADKEQLALAEKQLYYAHLERLELEGITEAQRKASDRFVALYEDTVRAQLPGPQQRGPRTQYAASKNPPTSSRRSRRPHAKSRQPRSKKSKLDTILEE
eukprot:CAMPEP_0118920012 /NCGR_PEP_ID=MMETSP1166-20130328/18854_1 /TAXON_ID=1104430 /ORGANISM="Chrysoreinhardia sp, Strain CCMP3193" /LENGTH=154 /DNA_ID=CAMNT_0006860549 /DNA_START=65 /DNA_END=529 /DNA_ORIENTATION=+